MQLQKHLFSFRARLQPLTPFAKKCVVAPGDIRTSEHDSNATILMYPNLQMNHTNTRPAAQFIQPNSPSHDNRSRILLKKFVAKSKAMTGWFDAYFTVKTTASLRPIYIYPTTQNRSSYLKI